MPNIKSQKKRVITNEKSTANNRSIKSSLKSTIKKAEASIAAGSEDSKTVLSGATSAIDKAAAKGVLHKNTAARKVSKMMKKANTAKA